MSFGSYSLVSLAEAREKRDVARKQVANDIVQLRSVKPKNLQSSFQQKTHSKP